MAKGNEIIVTAEPRGIFLEGFVSGTPKPGTCMQVVAGTEPIGGQHTWEVFDQTEDAQASLIAVLLPDKLQGKMATDAYVTGDRCYLYCPAMGEDVNMLLKNETGTADTHTIGERLSVDDGTGKLVTTAVGTGAGSVPFICMETLAALMADKLAWCKYTGH